MSRDRGYFSQVDAGRSVLDGHRPVKRGLVSPLSNLPLQKAINTTADIFPELLWIALLFDRYGYHRGLRLAMLLREALETLDGSRPWHRLSEISALSQTEWDHLEERDDNYRDDIVAAFKPLLLYEELPLAWVRPRYVTPGDALERLEQCVGDHANRFETPGAAVIGTFVFLEAYVGRIQVPGEMLARLSTIVDKPGSDEAEMASSSARALALAFWAAGTKEENNWPAAFWRANGKLSPCRVRTVDG